MFTLEPLVAPLDMVRGASLRFLSRSSLATRVLSRRETRIAAIGTAQVLLLLALTVRWPVALYFLGPVVLGVVHLAADVRYLAFRLPLPRSLLRASCVFVVALTAARVAVATGVIDEALGARVDIGLGMAFVGVSLSSRLRQRPWLLSLAWGALALAAALMMIEARWSDVALMHLHNVAAAVVWLTLFRRRPGWAALPLVVALCSALFLFSGASVPWTERHGGLSAFGHGARRLADSFAPGASPGLAISLTMMFVFLQSVHYGIWTGFISQDCLKGEGTPTFRMTVRSLTADFGLVGLLLVVLVTLGFAGLACWNLRLSVGWYMTLARAHVWFEIAVLAYFFGRAPVTSASMQGRVEFTTTGRTSHTACVNVAPTDSVGLVANCEDERATSGATMHAIGAA